MSETSDIVTPALKALKRLNVIAWRMNSGGRRGRVTLAPAGTPDILGVLAPSGRLFGLEAKLPGGKPTPVQAEWHARAQGSGVLVATIHSAADAVRVVTEWQQRERSEETRGKGESSLLWAKPAPTHAEPAPTSEVKVASHAPTATSATSARRSKRGAVGR